MWKRMMTAYTCHDRIHPAALLLLLSLSMLSLLPTTCGNDGVYRYVAVGKKHDSIIETF